MRHIRTDGIIVKRRNSGEADRILTVFTRALGKVSVKAVGVRKITSKRSSHIELLNSVSMTLYQGRAFPVLMEVQTTNTFPVIKSDLQRIGFAYHICELIDGLCPEHQENDALFSLLEKTLVRLGNDEDPTALVRDFEVSLLSQLGFYDRDTLLNLTDTSRIIESVMERKLKTKQLLHRFV